MYLKVIILLFELKKIFCKIMKVLRLNCVVLFFKFYKFFWFFFLYRCFQYEGGFQCFMVFDFQDFECCKVFQCFQGNIVFLVIIGIQFLIFVQIILFKIVINFNGLIIFGIFEFFIFVLRRSLINWGGKIICYFIFFLNLIMIGLEI